MRVYKRNRGGERGVRRLVGKGRRRRAKGQGQVIKSFNLAITYYQFKFRFMDSKCLCIQQNSIDNNISPYL